MGRIKIKIFLSSPPKGKEREGKEMIGGNMNVNLMTEQSCPKCQYGGVFRDAPPFQFEGLDRGDHA